MEEPPLRSEISQNLVHNHDPLPPTPPQSEDNTSESCNEDDEATTVPLPPLSTTPVRILPIDEKTPDAHVPRDSRLIRLTGVHPFNAEAPLTALFKEGFLTSTELFFVRNHGAVPQVQDHDIPDWEFSIEGMVEKPFTLSLRQLVSEYAQITLPVTFVCAGNRRKEQNQVKKSKGFSWGAAGVSTALFTGVFMWDVIERARPRKNARYVCMEGADQLPNGNYGTDVKLNWVRDPNKGIMLAYKMNGETLRPDHGKPLRAVVPGQIGGRSVKWLKRIIVTMRPSDNWYHIYDNRVLPTQVSPEESANNENWWKDERYAIHDLSPNSAIACPAHEEKIPLHDRTQKYRVQGYAYSGGGRRIARVELSLDQGKTWRLAHIKYPEDIYRDTDQMLFGGRLDLSWRESCFCWCLWSLETPIQDLEGARDVVVRCMDESMCVQPKDMYWSVLGMMNNPWFRVTVTREGDHLLFEHPTQPALIPGGWMERVKKAGGDLTNGRWGERVEGDEAVQKGDGEKEKEVCMTKDGLKHEIMIDELRAHDDEQAPWFVVNGEVYDGTPFIKEHPGGATSITAAAGQNASDEFMAIHSETAKAMMPTYHLGTLSASALKILADGDGPSNSPQELTPTFLNPRSWTTALLKSKRHISPDTLIFTFTLSHPTQTLGLPIGQHLMIRLHDPTTQSPILRAYTPISPPTQPGTLDVLIKLYLSPSAPGAMSRAIASLPLNHPVDFKGPIGKFVYHGRGHCTINGTPRRTPVRRFILVCAGSGVTPIYQVFRAVMRDSGDPTTCLVLNGNRCEGDILCMQELDALCREGAGRGEIVYTLSKPGEGWAGLRGRIDEGLIREKCVRGEDEGGEGVMVLCCGPGPLEKLVARVLGEDGWGNDQILFF